MKFKKLSGFRKKIMQTWNHKRYTNISKKLLLSTMEILGARGMEKKKAKRQKMTVLTKAKNGQQDRRRENPQLYIPSTTTVGSHPWRSVLQELWNPVRKLWKPSGVQRWVGLFKKAGPYASGWLGHCGHGYKPETTLSPWAMALFSLGPVNNTSYAKWPKRGHMCTCLRK